MIKADLLEQDVLLTGDINGQSFIAIYGSLKHENGTYVFYPAGEFDDYSVDYQTSNLSEALESLEEDVNANVDEVIKEIGLCKLSI